MKKVKGIIDRFEGEYAIIEFGNKTEDILRTSLPKQATYKSESTTSLNIRL
ncbi:DUF3006 domain-containing protein [Fictibacillus sp. KU28468]|uniref:DUF3006 domain-containing protein n=1 Tax=Fictibacillus sp. KU28468 TaxID=2991053 RepID=UPI00223DEEC6|nr:DUF3006 domain-containing protein [Fictibacillus sp. KU28468]UZJ79586.1 DUF3006 domain-containing protein [Fictibacillus sp. KU28468]